MCYESLVGAETCLTNYFFPALGTESVHLKAVFRVNFSGNFLFLLSIKRLKEGHGHMWPCQVI